MKLFQQRNKNIFPPTLRNGNDCLTLAFTILKENIVSHK